MLGLIRNGLCVHNFHTLCLTKFEKRGCVLKMDGDGDSDVASNVISFPFKIV